MRNSRLAALDTGQLYAQTALPDVFEYAPLDQGVDARPTDAEAPGSLGRRQTDGVS
jgi:hypothetical protein